MQQKTKDYLNGNGSPNLHAYCAFRAIMRAVGRTGLPKAYHSDLAIDADILYQHTQPIRLVMCLREHGTNLFWAGEMDRLEAEGKVFGQQCHFFTYDEDLIPADAYGTEPELLPCGYEEAVRFLTPRFEQWAISYHRVGDGVGCRHMWPGRGEEPMLLFSSRSEAEGFAADLVGKEDHWARIDQSEAVPLER